MPTIFTAVSKPGPAEKRLVDRLAGVASEKRRIGAGVAIRTLDAPGPADRASIFFLHGRGHSSAAWAPLIPELAASRRVIAADLPGFGHSGMTDLPAAPSPEEALAAFVDPLEELVSAEPSVVLVGHSLGGLAALSLTLRGRAKVRGLVLICAMGLGPYVSPSARAYLRVGPERIAKLTRFFGGARGLSNGAAIDADLAAFRQELYLARGGRAHGKRAFDALVPLFGDAFNVRDRLSEISVPVLLLWGDRDEAFPLPVAMDAHARIPQSKLEVLHTGHSPHLEDPSAVIRRIRAFLDASVDSPSKGGA